MKNRVIEAIEREKLIVIVRGVAAEKLLPLAQAMYDGGVRLLEITYDASGKTPAEQTAQSIRALAAHFGESMHIGAGTVLTPHQVELTAQAGGKFIISPNTNPEVIAKTVELGLVSIPGSLTPTEIALANASGADFVKLFPADAFAPSYVKAVLAPLSNVRLLAVGGIDDTNMATYRKFGACGFGVSSSIVDKKLIEANDFEGITKLAQRFVAAAQG